MQPLMLYKVRTCMLSHFSHVQLFVIHGLSLLGSSVHGILQARILEWVAMPSSRGSSRSNLRVLPLLHWQASSLPLVPPGKPMLYNSLSNCGLWSISWQQIDLVDATAAAKLLQSCLTLCNPIDCSPPGSSIPGILQARTLEWVAISFSNAWKWKVKVKSLSCVWFFATLWTCNLPDSSVPAWDFPGKSTGVGCHCLLLI